MMMMNQMPLFFKVVCIRRRRVMAKDVLDHTEPRTEKTVARLPFRSRDGKFEGSTTQICRPNPNDRFQVPMAPLQTSNNCRRQRLDEKPVGGNEGDVLSLPRKRSADGHLAIIRGVLAICTRVEVPKPDQKRPRASM